MENPYHSLLLDITNYFVENRQSHERLGYCRSISTLIRIHSEKLQHFGECSFSCKPEIWTKYFPNIKGFELNESAFELQDGDERQKQFQAVAKEWKPFPVARLEIKQERCHLYLQRSVVIRNLIQQVLHDTHYGNLRKSESRAVRVRSLLEYGLSHDDLSFYRAKLMHQTLKRLLQFSRYTLDDCDDATLTKNNQHLELNVVSVASKVSQDLLPQKPSVIIKCGLVNDPSTKGKICQLPAQEYIR